MSAPASQAALASGQLVMPQILTRIMASLIRKRRAAEKSSEGRRWIGREHETLADQKGVEAGGPESQEIVVRAESGFADYDASIGDALDEFEGGLDTQAESFQVAVVDADDVRSGGEGAIELSGGVDFHERLHADLAAERDEIAKKFIVERSNNEQEAVGVVGARLPDLPGIENEVFAKDGHFYSMARIAKVFQGAAKEFAFRQHGQHGRACCFQGLCQLDGMEGIAENSFRGRSGLKLCDNIQGIAGKRSAKIAQRPGRVDAVAQRRFRKDTFAVVDLQTACLKNAIEDGPAVSMGAHGHCSVC